MKLAGSAKIRLAHSPLLNVTFHDWTDEWFPDWWSTFEYNSYYPHQSSWWKTSTGREGDTLKIDCRSRASGYFAMTAFASHRTRHNGSNVKSRDRCYFDEDGRSHEYRAQGWFYTTDNYNDVSIKVRADGTDGYSPSMPSNNNWAFLETPAVTAVGTGDTLASVQLHRPSGDNAEPDIYCFGVRLLIDQIELTTGWGMKDQSRRIEWAGSGMQTRSPSCRGIQARYSVPVTGVTSSQKYVLEKWVARGLPLRLDLTDDPGTDDDYLKSGTGADVRLAKRLDFSPDEWSGQGVFTWRTVLTLEGRVDY